MSSSAEHELADQHTPEAIAQRIVSSHSHTFVGDFVLGAVDGTITTFAIVAGVAGANYSVMVAIVLGFANLLADGFSMAISNYLKARADQQTVNKFRKLEEMHIEQIPEGEREEIRQIYEAKGFSGELLNQVVDTICDDRTQWIDTMLKEEWGLQLETPDAWKSGMVTFGGFVVAGAVPLIPLLLTYVGLPDGNVFLYCSLLTAIAFVLIGIFRAKVLQLTLWKSIVETLATGGIAAIIAYYVGVILDQLVQAA